MRILSVTQSYAPFYEFGGPPVKVEALANGLAQRGHSVTVLSADWGFKARQASEKNTGKVGRSPFGWTREANGVESVYLPTWFRYRAESWNPTAAQFCRANLGCTICWGRRWRARAGEKKFRMLSSRSECLCRSCEIF